MIRHKYEYVKVQEDRIEYELNWYNDAGWELVSTTNSISDNESWFFLSFKKESGYND